MMQQLATQRTEIAPPSAEGAQSNQNSSQEKGNEFAAVFSQQEQRSTQPKKANTSDKRSEPSNVSSNSDRAKSATPQENESQTNKAESNAVDAAEQSTVKDQAGSVVSNSDKNSSNSNEAESRNNDGIIVQQKRQVETDAEDTPNNWLTLIQKIKGISESLDSKSKDIERIEVKDEEAISALQDQVVEQITVGSESSAEDESLKDKSKESLQNAMDILRNQDKEEESLATKVVDSEIESDTSEQELILEDELLTQETKIPLDVLMANKETNIDSEDEQDSDVSEGEESVEFVGTELETVESESLDDGLKILNDEKKVEPQLSKHDLEHQLNEELAALLNPTLKTDNQTAKDNIDNKEVDPLLLKLSQLPEQKLEKVLDNLARRLPINNEQDSNSEQSFIANLKAGLAEFKAQIKQGHEPGIDLAALVNETVSKLQQSGANIEANSEQLTKPLNAFTRILESGTVTQQPLNDPMQSLGMEKVTQRENSQAIQDVAKMTSQLTPQSEKAINITRPEGHQQLVEKVRVMANQKNMVAEIRLDPPDLGSMQIKINMQGEQASVNFVVQSQAAKETLDQAAPKLAEMLSEKGIDLGQSDVQQEGKGKETDDDANQKLANDGDREEDDSSEGLTKHDTRIVNGAVGGIDYFA